MNVEKEVEGRWRIKTRKGMKILIGEKEIELGRIGIYTIFRITIPCYSMVRRLCYVPPTSTRVTLEMQLSIQCRSINGLGFEPMLSGLRSQYTYPSIC